MPAGTLKHLIVLLQNTAAALRRAAADTACSVINAHCHLTGGKPSDWDKEPRYQQRGPRRGVAFNSTAPFLDTDIRWDHCHKSFRPGQCFRRHAAHAMRPVMMSAAILARKNGMSSWEKSMGTPRDRCSANWRANTPQSQPFCCRGTSLGYLHSQ